MINSQLLVELNAKTETTKFVEKHIERLGNAWSWHRLALDNGFVGFRTAYHVIRLDSKNLLQHMAGGITP